MWNVTHILLVVGKDVMRVMTLPFTECGMSLTNCWSCDKNHKIAFHKMCNVTYILLVIAKDVMRLPFTRIFNVAHILLVIGKNYLKQLLRNQLLRNICNATDILLAIGKI